MQQGMIHAKACSTQDKTHAIHFSSQIPIFQFSMKFHAKSHDQLYAVRKPIKQAIIAQNVNRGKR